MQTVLKRQNGKAVSVEHFGLLDFCSFANAELWGAGEDLSSDTIQVAMNDVLAVKVAHPLGNLFQRHPQ